MFLLGHKGKPLFFYKGKHGVDDLAGELRVLVPPLHLFAHDGTPAEFLLAMMVPLCPSVPASVVGLHGVQLGSPIGPNNDASRIDNVRDDAPESITFCPTQ